MGWPLVRLGEVAEQIDRTEAVVPNQAYTLLGMRSKIGGPFARETKRGAEISATKLNRVEAGDFIFSRLFAWQGSFGTIPPALEGSYVSNEFPIFRLDSHRVDPSFLVYWFGLPATQHAVEMECSGSTPGTRNRYKEKYFNNLSAPLPPLAEQQRIVARLDRVAGLVAGAKSRRAQTDADATQLLERLHFDLASNDQRPFGDFVSLSEDRTEVAPDQSYPQIGIRGFAGGLFFKEATAGSDTSYKSFNRVHPDMLVVSQPKGWEGAIAVAEDEHAGWFVSPEYRTFVCRDGSLLPAYLRQLVGTNWFQSELAKLTRGQGARRERLRPDMLLDMPVRMPSIAAQRKTLAIHEKIQRLRAHTAPFARDADALIPALLHEVFNGKAVAA